MIYGWPLLGDEPLVISQGLGMHLWYALEQKTPTVAVAKTQPAAPTLIAQIRAPAATKRVAAASMRSSSSVIGVAPGVVAAANAPVNAAGLEPGFYIISFQRKGAAKQQAPFNITRDSTDPDLVLVFPAPGKEENMALISAGDVSAEGVASSTRPDAQAKGLGEYVRSRLVDIPTRLAQQ